MASMRDGAKHLCSSHPPHRSAQCLRGRGKLIARLRLPEARHLLTQTDKATYFYRKVGATHKRLCSLIDVQVAL
jgi:hypothetical protein